LRQARIHARDKNVADIGDEGKRKLSMMIKASLSGPKDKLSDDL